jgi:PTH1 family peptidyl-tRNA hydrolase
MRLIVGLGNPGTKYAKTRHSVGYMAIDKLLTEIGDRPDIVLVKPTTFMNDSGVAVREAFKNSNIKLSDLYIIHDDLDIPLGTYKIQLGKGPKTHKGLLSIYEKLGTKDFWHVRIGVENRADKNISGEAYTLMPFEPAEKEIINGVLDEVCKKLVI